MAAKYVNVVNKDTNEYSETTRDGDLIVIPAGGSVKMRRSEAIKFLGTYPGVSAKTGKKIVKALFMEDINDGVNEVAPVVVVKEEAYKPVTEEGIACPMCNKRFPTKLGLATHLRSCRA